MKKLNKKGFTLIELLAVIVILAVVLGIAIPAVSQYITKSKKNGYKSDLLEFVDAARNVAALGEDYTFPTDSGEALVIPFEKLTIALEKGGKESPYGNAWDEKGSFVMIVNKGTADSPRYEYFVQASDGKYATGEGGKVHIYDTDSLKAENIIRVDTDLPAASSLNGKSYYELPDNPGILTTEINDTVYCTVTEVAD